MRVYEVEQIINYKRQKVFIKAENLTEARELASKSNQGIIIKITQTKNIPLDMQIAELKEQFSKSMRFSKIKIPRLVASIRQLSVMTNAGISIHDSIKEVAKSTADKKLKMIFEGANNDLNAGMSLTESLVTYEKDLGNIVIAMVRLGEEAGNLAEALKKLADILQEVWDNQVKFKKAIRYPIAVVVVIALAFIVLMVFVVPKFRDIFEQLNATLPLPTRILLGIESSINNYGEYLLIGFIAFIFLIKKIYQKNDSFKGIVDKYVLKIYLIGGIIFYSTMSRFSLVFAELIKAGIPIAEALDTACMTIQNSYMKNKMLSVKQNVQRGNSLNDSFKDTGLYESMLIQMISAGEKSGSLDLMLEKVTDYYKEKFDNIIDNIASYIEPILLVFIAAMVILLGLGIFMPMWDMANAVR